MSGLRKSVQPLENYVAKLESQSQHETNMWVKQESKNRKVQLSQVDRNKWGLAIHALDDEKKVQEKLRALE